MIILTEEQEQLLKEIVEAFKEGTKRYEEMIEKLQPQEKNHEQRE